MASNISQTPDQDLEESKSNMNGVVSRKRAKVYSSQVESIKNDIRIDDSISYKVDGPSQTYGA
jgi:hypothetical protein